MKVTLVVPVLNEEDCMRKIMPTVNREWCDQILVVDGGSKDGSVAYAKEMGYEVITQSGKGLVCAFHSAVPYIRNEIVVAYSPDGNSVASFIPALADKIREGNEVVIASRYKDGGVSEDDNFITKFGNHMFTWMIRLTFGSPITDSLVIYRAYSLSALRKMHLTTPLNVGMEKHVIRYTSWEVLSSIRVGKLKMRVAEIAAPEPPRVGGKAKVQPFRMGLAVLGSILQEIWWWKVSPDTTVFKKP